MLAYFMPAIVLTLAGFAIAYRFVDPAPPLKITIATGPSSGAYYDIGTQYSRVLARDGVTLIVRETTGSVENLKLLDDPASGVDVIFMQGGIGADRPSDNLLSLGSIYYEPLWVFHRADLGVRHLGDLRGRRIAVGVDGSGTKMLARQLLGLNSVDAGNSQLLSLNEADSVRMLLAGEIDAAFFVVAYRGRGDDRLMLDPDVRLMSFVRAEAYTRRMHFLSLLKFPQGAFNFTYNLPEQDIYLLAPTAQLVVRDDFHPALIDLLLNAAKEVGSPASLFERRGDFPAPRYMDFPLSGDAERFYDSGQHWLQRLLPFWLASLVSRMTIMLLPLVALLFPLARLLPPFYRWRMRSRIYRWYDQLMQIDYEILNEGVRSRNQEYLARLDVVERNVSQISVPLGFSRELYDMRVHIQMLREKLAGAVADRGRHH
jgi:TRAP transporter TAXI family solute receptor